MAQLGKPDKKTIVGICTASLAVVLVGWQWSRVHAEEAARMAREDSPAGQNRPGGPRGSRMAQEGGPNGGQGWQSGQGGAGGWQQGGAGRGQGGPGGGWQNQTPEQRQARQKERMDKMTKELNLTPEQQTKMQQFMEQRRTQMQAMWQNGGAQNMSREQRREEMKRMRVDSREQMKQILNADQMAKMESMQQQQRAQWQNGGRGRGGE